MLHSKLSRTLIAPFFGGPIYVLFVLFAVVSLIPFVPFILGEALLNKVRREPTAHGLDMIAWWASKLFGPEQYIISKAVPEDASPGDVSVWRMVPGSFLLCFLVAPAVIFVFVAVMIMRLAEKVGAGVDAIEEWTHSA